MIVHLFNSSLVSGPETLVIPSLPSLKKKVGEIEVWNLAEVRRGAAVEALLEYTKLFNVKTRAISVQAQFDSKAIQELADQLKAVAPTIVHAHDVKASVYLALAARKLGKDCTFKMITTHHGINARNGIKVRIYEWIYRFGFLKRFDAVLTVSSLDRETLIKHGFDPKRVMVHLNGVDRRKITHNERFAVQRSVREQWTKELGITIRDKRLLAVAARLSPEKNHMLLLDALADFKKRVHDIPFLCICFGVGPLEAVLKARTKELGLEDVVLWAGYRKNLSHDMPGMDLLLSLSVGEGLPINLLEAGWSRTPILATAVDGVNDLIPKEDPVLSLSRLEASPPAKVVSDRLEQLLRRPDLRETLGEAFQKRVEESFSGDAWERTLQAIYERVRAN